MRLSPGTIPELSRGAPEHLLHRFNLGIVLEKEGGGRFGGWGRVETSCRSTNSARRVISRRA